MALELNDTILKVAFKNGTSLEKRVKGEIGLEDIIQAREHNREDPMILFMARDGSQIMFNYFETTHLELKPVSNLDTFNNLGH